MENNILNIYKDIEGTVFPAGRHTRVMVGVNSPLQAENYVIGTSTLFPGGSVPEHGHETEETYIILSGNGVMTLDGVEHNVSENTVIYIPPNQLHELKNTGDTEMKTIFVYSPAVVVDHWAKESKGELK